jgi:NAD(P)-dependent dehydrogenase (short-subunit alcohol dehydrogenase family)
MDPKLFAGKVYLVTGGNKGIGLAVSEQLLGYGAIVYVTDVQPEASPELLAAGNQNLHYVQSDVRHRVSCQSLVSQIAANHSHLDGLVNNAGICPLEGERPPDAMFDEVVDVNLTGVWNVGIAALAQMQKQGSGSLVNVGSVSSLVGVPRLPAYTATKHAVLGLTRTWALDYAKYGIRVNCIAPGECLVPCHDDELAVLTSQSGATDTDMSRSPLKTVMGPRFGLDKTEDELLEMVAQSLPLKRIGKPAEIATAINFFLSDLASFITGQILAVSGGQ